MFTRGARINTVDFEEPKANEKCYMMSVLLPYQGIG